MQTPLAVQLRQSPTPIATAGLEMACPCTRGRHPNGVGSGEWKTMPLNDIFRFVAREMRGDVLKADTFTFVVYDAGIRCGHGRHSDRGAGAECPFGVQDASVDA